MANDYGTSDIFQKTLKKAKLYLSELNAGYILNSEQLDVLYAVDQGENVFFTGSAGTGKSFLTKRIIALLKERYPVNDAEPRKIAITAPSGVAASCIGGLTIHGRLRLKVPYEPAHEYIARAKQETQQRIKKGLGELETLWRALKVLIIDEISMVSSDFFATLEEIARALGPHRNKPWGGIQIIVAGDFHQLPSVEGQYAFDAQVWDKTYSKQVELTQVCRQDDPGFIKILSEVRLGIPSAETCKILHSLSRPLDMPLGLAPVSLRPTKKEVLAVNRVALGILEGPGHTYDAIDTGAKPGELDNYCRYPETLELRIGAQVMLVANKCVETGLYNGRIGKVVGFEQEKWGDKREYPVVLFDNGEKTTIWPDTWKYGELRPTLSRTQLPLILAWAITIHKCQGLTIPFVVVDVSKVFVAGQLYVALSRVQQMSGLQVIGFYSKLCEPNIVVDDFYEKLRQRNRVQ